jgi:tetratricopeptide (TPR) repeat protein
MKVRLIQIAVLIGALALAPAAARSQEPPARPLAAALAIEDPAERIAAIQRFLKTNSLPEQAQAAREAIVNAHAQLGEAQLGENNIERAAEEFRRGLASLPDKVADRFFEDTVLRIPLAVSLRGYRNEAATLARQLEKRFAREAPRLARIGEFYLTIEAPADAIRALEAASKLSEEDATLHRALGAAYRIGLRLDDAVAEYQQAIRFDPKDKRAYYELANLYRAHGAHGDAARLYQKQIELEPKHTPSHKGLALAYLALGRDDDAAAALNQARDIRGAIEEITGDIYLQTQLAFQYLSRGKLKEARQAADAALYVEPRYAWARIAAAEIEMADGKYFDAERHLLAAKNYASFPSLFFTLGKLYLAVEDFDGALEQFGKAFTVTPQKQFAARLGGTLDLQADTLKELLAREHQASIFLAEPPTLDEQFKIAESLVRFNTRLRMLKMAPPVNRPVRGQTKPGQPSPPESNPEARRKQLEELDQAAMGFVEAENVRRSFRMLYIAGQLANAGVATGLAIELADQALGLADVATEFEGSVREYPNYDRTGRLNIFRGRALEARGWALFKINRTEESLAALGEAVQAYGALPEGKRAIRRLATVKESAGDLKDALELHIAAYEAPENPGRDVNRAVIEALYRKVNGSLNGLDQRIGPAPVIAVAAKSAEPKSARPAPRPAFPTMTPSASSAVGPASPSTDRPFAGGIAGQPEPPNKSAPVLSLPAPSTGNSAGGSAGRKLPAPTKPPAPLKLKELPQSASAAPPPPVQDVIAAEENPTVSTSSTAPAPILRKLPEKPVALPALPASETTAIRVASRPESGLTTPARAAIGAEGELPPPPPTPQLHTRKRRVTTPDNE